MTKGLRGLVVAALGMVVVLRPATASAQGTSQDRVAGAIGKDVTVTLKDGKKQRGKLRVLSATEFELDQSTDLLRPKSYSSIDFKFSLDNVRQIQRNAGSIGKGLGIGLAAGLTAGLVIVAVTGGPGESGFGSDSAFFILMSAGIGAGAGAGISTALRRSEAARMVYQSPTMTSVSLSPTIGRGKLGVAGMIRW